MKIKKYVAPTEQEAIDNVKKELGLDALIINIKKVQPKGIFALFRKPSVEVTAAYDEKSGVDDTENFKRQKMDFLKRTKLLKKVSDPEGEDAPDTEDNLALLKDGLVKEQQEKIQALQREIDNKELLLAKAMNQLSAAAYLISSERKYESNIVQIFYDTLTEQGVYPEVAEKVLEDVDSIDDIDKIDINFIVKIVYNTIISILGEPENIHTGAEPPYLVCFIGPTGVGKTTTIAKLTSDFILNQDQEVGLITADTYRIAAVEQLKTYADILGIEVGVCYNPEDLSEHIQKMKKRHDVIFVDTAGRSHTNEKMLEELKELLAVVPQSEKYLVLSLTTKCEDLIQIIRTYDPITDFKLIFTKLDETASYGPLLNVCYLTGRKVAYLTNGQNVPDDIEQMRPEKIAKALLGFGGVEF